MTANKKTTQPIQAVLKVTAKVDGFRRAGREWHGVTQVAKDELTETQIAQLEAEPRLVVETIEKPAEEDQKKES